MDSFQSQLEKLLRRSAEQLRQVRLPETLADYPDRLERLAEQVYHPCTLAVVGRAKAGKSTFINAFLGEDLAKVGVTETTATLNFFRYGNPPDPARPIRCFWRNGQDEYVDRQFLDSLQGHAPEIVQRAAQIHHLEYLLPHPSLKEVTLVDTPGTEAAVLEHHEQTKEFLQLRQQHAQATRQWAERADAVIYLVGPVARLTDQQLLEEFTQATSGQARALNALGVLAKVDLQPELLQRREQLAAKIAQQLRDSLNTVLPVSAGLRRALDRFQKDKDSFRKLRQKLQQIPAKLLSKLLDSEELYKKDYPDCPVSVAERIGLRGDMPWGVFTTIARLAADATLTDEEVLEKLEEWSGFGPLKEVLEQHFFRRSKLLRCFSILREVRTLLDDLRYNYLPQIRKKDQQHQALRERYQLLLRTVQEHEAGDLARRLHWPEGEVRTTVKDLVDLVNRVIPTDRADLLSAVLQDLDRQFSELYHKLEEYNADFEGLLKLEKRPEFLTDGECEELRRLFGLHGLDPGLRLPPDLPPGEKLRYIQSRQEYWRERQWRGRQPELQQLAELAERRYGWLLAQETAR